MSRHLALVIVLTISFFGKIEAQQVEVQENLRKSVEFFSSDSLKGRKAGTRGETLAAEYFYNHLKSSGIYMLTSVEGEDFSIAMEGDTIYSRNIIGLIEGSDSLLKKEYVVIGANLDNIGTNVLTVNKEKQMQIFLGADANASGLACVMEIAQQIAATSFLFKRSIIVAGFGAKEYGMAGSWDFVNRTFKEIKDVSLMVNLDMVGRSGPLNFLSYYTCVPNVEINSIVGNIAKQTSFIFPEQGIGATFPSDYLAFYEKNIPVTLFTTGKHRDFHTVRDTPEALDYESMERICNYVYSFVMDVANRDTKISSVDYASDGREGGEPVYSPYEVDKAPKFFKGDEKTFLEKWVYAYLKYPEVPLKMGIQGDVIVEFIIETDGSLSNIKIVKGIDDYLDDEVIRVVSVSPKWKSGEISGRKVRVKYSIPVTFKLKKK